MRVCILLYFIIYVTLRRVERLCWMSILGRIITNLDIKKCSSIADDIVYNWKETTEENIKDNGNTVKYNRVCVYLFWIELD